MINYSNQSSHEQYDCVIINMDAQKPSYVLITEDEIGDYPTIGCTFMKGNGRPVATK